MARNVETKTQHLRRAQLKQKSKVQGDKRPYFAFVKEYNSAADTTLVDSHGGRRILFNPQPHLGRTAWMRVAPEGGMGSLLITRSDAEEPEHMRWWHTDTQNRLTLFRRNVESLSNGSGQLISNEAFRPIESGEIDIASRGGSQVFLGNRPHLDMRAGIIKFTMDQDEAEASVKAPTHILRGHQNTSNAIGDEERFGIVKRPDNGSYVRKFYVDPDGNRDEDRLGKGFAKEHLIRLSNPQLSNPSILFDVRSGHSMDDQGQPYRLNGEKLRVRAEYFTSQDTSVLFQLDELGNFSLEHPNEATTGGRFVMPKGSIDAEIGVDFKREIGRNEESFIGADRVDTVGNNETRLIRNTKKLTVIGDEVRIVKMNQDETVDGNKEVLVKGIYSIVTGDDEEEDDGETSKLNFTNQTSSFETQTLTILAEKEIIFEAPEITFNTSVANFTGLIRTEGGIHSNSTNVAPNGVRGRAGGIAKKSAIRT